MSGGSKHRKQCPPTFERNVSPLQHADMVMGRDIS